MAMGSLPMSGCHDRGFENYRVGSLPYQPSKSGKTSTY